jgi:hypothetical protein
MYYQRCDHDQSTHMCSAALYSRLIVLWLPLGG